MNCNHAMEINVYQKSINGYPNIVKFHLLVHFGKEKELLKVIGKQSFVSVTFYGPYCM